MKKKRANTRNGIGTTLDVIHFNKIFAIGHHPLYASGKRIKNPETLQFKKNMEPVFKKFNVSTYISGHEDQLEYIKPEGPTSFYFGCRLGSEKSKKKFTGIEIQSL